MPLQPTGRKQEKIIAFGDNGSGKSSIYISIAQWYKRAGNTEHVHVVDFNHAWDGNRPEDGSLDSIVVPVDVDVSAFDRAIAAVERLKARVKPNDWIVVDQMDQAWEGAQRYYWGQKSGNDSLAELWLKNEAKDIAGDHGINWGVINKFYGDFRTPLLTSPCHILMLSSASPVREPNQGGKGGDSLEVRTFYEGIGYRMGGQKDLRGDAHTVIYCRDTPIGYLYDTVKERGPLGQVKRDKMTAKKVGDSGFVGAYLMPVAKWKIG